MTALRWLAAYGAALVTMLGLDTVWLTQMGPRLYRPVLGDLLAAEPRLVPAVLFYLLYVAGVLALCVVPGRTGATAAKGALFGLVAYATYDLTNQATLRNWTTALTLADLAWGTALTCVAATVGSLVTRRVPRP